MGCGLDGGRTATSANNAVVGAQIRNGVEPATLSNMTTQRRRLYQSSNGDAWYLCRGRDGKIVVAHEPSEGSGLNNSVLEIGLFLTTAGAAPQHQALLQLIGELVDPSHTPNKRQEQERGWLR